jgi:hypothetical protein
MMVTIRPRASTADCRENRKMTTSIIRWLVAGLAITIMAGCVGIAVGAEDGQMEIGHGYRDGVGWSVSLRSVSAPESTRSACIEVAIQSRRLVSETSECGSVTTELPLWSRLAIGKGKGRFTVFAAVMPPQVERVALNLASRGYQKSKVRRLSAKDADSSGLEPFAYLARAFTGPVCIRRLRAYGGEGELLTDISFIRCHES